MRNLSKLSVRHNTQWTTLEITNPQNRSEKYPVIRISSRTVHPDTYKTQLIMRHIAKTINALKIDYPYPTTAARPNISTIPEQSNSKPDIDMKDLTHAWFSITTSKNRTGTYIKEAYENFQNLPNELKPYYIILGCQNTKNHEDIYRAYANNTQLLDPTKELPEKLTNPKIDKLNPIYTPKYVLTSEQYAKIHKLNPKRQTIFIDLINGLIVGKNATRFLDQIIETIDPPTGKEINEFLATKNVPATIDKKLGQIPNNVLQLLKHATDEEIVFLVPFLLRQSRKAETGIIVELLQETLSPRETIEFIIKMKQNQLMAPSLSTLQKAVPDLKNILDVPFEWWVPLYSGLYGN